MPPPPAPYLGPGHLIAERRRALGLTQAYVAEQVGISQQYLSRLERGWHKPSAELLDRFAAVLEMNRADLDPGWL